MRGKFFAFLFFMLLPQVLPAQQKPRIVKLPELQKILETQTDTLYVLNFWATWCVPCVQELPYFEDAKAHFADEKVQILLISLDFKKDFEKRLLPFVKRKNLQNTVWLLDETDYNKWIDIVSPQWGGAIPFTLIFNNNSGIKQGYEKSFTQQELLQTITINLNK